MKMRVSSQWTPQERLDLIALITSDHAQHNQLMLPMDVLLIHGIATLPVEMLERNRQNFVQYLESDKGE